MRYIALLRGINVGGQKKIKMIELKKVFELLEFKNVRTYIQSGNIMFDCDSTDEFTLATQIENKISESFQFLVKVIIRSSNEFKNIITNNPFIKVPDIELDRLYVTFMSDVPIQTLISFLDARKEENDKFTIISRQIYLYLPNGYGRTKLNNTFIEKKLKTVATTRNWKTINNIALNLI